MKDKFTPGPWCIDSLSVGTPWNIDATDGTAIALAQQMVGDDRHQKQRIANTLLIAAAPELLEALEAALEWIDAVPSEIALPAMPGFDRDWVNSIIKKARG